MSASKISFLSQANAKAIDVALMSSQFGFRLEQLMELAGLSVASSISKAYPDNLRVLVVCGPGNNGGDGLVAARHLKHFGYLPSILYPKETTNPLFLDLLTQCRALSIPIRTQDDPNRYDMILDAVFGFSFTFGSGIRAPYASILEAIKASTVTVVSIDIPSGWDVERGNVSGTGIIPDMLISLTAPKLCAKYFSGKHYLGGRFVPESLISDYSLALPAYPGADQCVELQ